MKVYLQAYVGLWAFIIIIIRYGFILPCVNLFKHLWVCMDLSCIDLDRLVLTHKCKQLFSAAGFCEFGAVGRSGGLQADLLGGLGGRSPPGKREVTFCT